jgi:hypothetical protein
MRAVEAERQRIRPVSIAAPPVEQRPRVISSWRGDGEAAQPVERQSPGLRGAPSEKARRRQKALTDYRRIMRDANTLRLDVRVVAKAIAALTYTGVIALIWYERAHRFVDAHCGGVVGDKQLRSRRALCNSECSWYVKDDKDRAYCRGCDCPQWPAARMGHKLRLARFKCPKGKF